MDLNEFKNAYKDCAKCSNCLTSTKVFGIGPIPAKIVVVGEGPGREEIANLIPFIGPAGQLLNKILESIGIQRKDTYFTNALLCRTNNSNRTPIKEEYTNCRTRLFQELSIVKPRYTILAGLTPLKSLMGESYKMGTSHGLIYTLLDKPCYYYFSIYHPAWILHSSNDEEAKARRIIMFNDITKFKEAFENLDQLSTGSK